MRMITVLPFAMLASVPAEAAQIDDATAMAMAKPQELVIARDIAQNDIAALLAPVDSFYGYRINGNPALLAKSLSPQFVDHALPPGRPQGPAGAAASKALLAAVPDLNLAVALRLVVGDRIVSHLRFTGHFTGELQGVHGKGQQVDFVATDILRVDDGRITDDWHVEDNLTFQQQTGLVPKR